MPKGPSIAVAVVLERRELDSRWATHEWQAASVLPDVGGMPRVLVDRDGIRQVVFPGFEVALYADEAEGYYLNASSGQPCVFVSIRCDEEGADPYPFQVTASYNEASRWMDGGERVDRALAGPEFAAWLGSWVEDNYRPEPKRRIRPRSFDQKDPT